jgi:hypothetical protein
MRDNHRMADGFCGFRGETESSEFCDQPLRASARFAIERRIGAHAWNSKEIRKARRRLREAAINLSNELRGGREG